MVRAGWKGYGDETERRASLKDRGRSVRNGGGGDCACVERRTGQGRGDDSRVTGTDSAAGEERSRRAEETEIAFILVCQENLSDTNKAPKAGEGQTSLSSAY